MAQVDVLRVIRELARSYQAFEALSIQHIRTLGLTGSQFDIIATLGNTDGMTFKQLGEKTLITKGTLTGVVDRLEAKSLVRRVASVTDGRSQIVQLTATGVALFERIFPAQVAHIEEAFAGFQQVELQHMVETLVQLGDIFRKGKKSS